MASRTIAIHKTVNILENFKNRPTLFFIMLLTEGSSDSFIQPHIETSSLPREQKERASLHQKLIVEFAKQLRECIGTMDQEAQNDLLHHAIVFHYALRDREPLAPETELFERTVKYVHELIA